MKTNHPFSPVIKLGLLHQKKERHLERGVRGNHPTGGSRVLGALRDVNGRDMVIIYN